MASVMRTTAMLDALLEYVRQNGRVCPQPQRWNELWEMLPGRRRVGNGWEPAVPLILAAWWDTPALVKMSGLEEHIRYADAHGGLADVDRYLRGLPEEEWAHLADFDAAPARAPRPAEPGVTTAPVTRLAESSRRDLDTAQRVLRSWAESRSFVRRLWIYGSRAKGTHSSTSDLDVAIDFDPLHDENCETTWVCEGQEWQDELQALLPWRLQLEWYDPGGSTPRIASGIADGGILIYERAP